MNTKRHYEALEIEIVTVENADVLTFSQGHDVSPTEL